MTKTETTVTCDICGDPAKFSTCIESIPFIYVINNEELVEIYQDADRAESSPTKDYCESCFKDYLAEIDVKFSDLEMPKKDEVLSKS